MSAYFDFIWNLKSCVICRNQPQAKIWPLSLPTKSLLIAEADLSHCILWMNWTCPEATKKLAKVNYILNILAHWHFSAKLFSFHLKSSLQNCVIKAPSVGWFWPYGLAHTFLGIKLFYDRQQKFSASVWFWILWNLTKFQLIQFRDNF